MSAQNPSSGFRAWGGNPAEGMRKEEIFGGQNQKNHVAPQQERSADSNIVDLQLDRESCH